MKKLLIVVELFIAVLIFTACRATSPFSYPLTKWIGKGFEVYVNEQGSGYILYKTSEKTMVFDAECIHGGTLYIYEHRELAEQKVELLVEYNTAGINNEKECKFNNRILKDVSYSNIFPNSIVFKKQCDITSDDIEYVFYEVERDKQGNIVQPK